VPDDADRTSADDSLVPPSIDDDAESVAESTQTAGSRRRYIAAFAVTVAVVIVVLGLLPSALTSMVRELRGQAMNSVYDLFTGTEVDVDETFGPNTAFVNITVTNLDESSRTATLTVSGHRVWGDLPTDDQHLLLARQRSRRTAWIAAVGGRDCPRGIGNLYVYHRASYSWYATALSVRHLHAAFGLGNLRDAPQWPGRGHH
jgi:hypothetical protein